MITRILVCIFMRCDFGFVQYNYMAKLSLLAFLLILVLSAHAQHRPQPPVRIITRTISVKTFLNNFLKVFCAHCDPSTKYCDQNLDRVGRMPETGNFQPVNISNNKYNITGATLVIGNVNVNCSFPGQSINSKTMDYALYMPISETKALKGVVIYYHPTLFGTKQVPTADTDQVKAIAALYLTSAYAIVFIDYLGYKQNDRFPHPYVQYAFCNVKSSIIALNHALGKLRGEFNFTKLQLFAAGYSEGAAYAIWLERCLYQPQDCEKVALDPAYQYQAAAAMDGPYDLISIIKPFLTREVARFPEKDNQYRVQTQVITNFGKPPLLAMTVISYMYYSLGVTDYSQKMNKEFWRMQCTHKPDQKKCQVNGTQYEDIFAAIRSRQDSIAIAKSIAHSAFGKKYNNTSEVTTYLGYEQAVYMNYWTNSVYGLADKQLMNTQLFNDTIRKASAINYLPRKKVFVFTLKQDSVVSPNNTLIYYNTFSNLMKVSMYVFANSQYQVCELNPKVGQNVDHNNGQVLANLFALTFIKSNTRQQI